MPEPLVRVVDAALQPHGGPVHVAVERLPEAGRVAAAVARAGGWAVTTPHGLEAVVAVDGLVAAVRGAVGPQAATTVGEAVARAVAGWRGSIAPLWTPAGSLPTDERVVVMGIVNVTPDSFSDGGDHDTAAAAIEHAEALARAGADVLDVGGESTRPGAAAVDAATELARVEPVVAALADAGHVVSVDTTKAAVARVAVERGAAIVNDVSAGELDDELLPTVAALGVPYVLMHMRGTPRTMQDDPRYDDVVADVFRFLGDRLDRCHAAGIARERVVVDPGIGFGKTTRHNLELLAGLRQFASLGRPVLVGASRKRFLGEVAAVTEARQRVVPSAAAAALAVREGATIVRVHDVAETVQAVRLATAVRDRARDPATGDEQ